MPELSGLDVLRQLPPPRPKIIFVTAYERFAVDAFGENACDYLVKPFTPERFEGAVKRARSELEGERKLRDLEHAMTAAGHPLARLSFRAGNRVDVVPVSEITCLVSRDDYTCAYAGGREHLTDLSLAHLEERLDPRVFRRVHRSALVNVRHVRSVMAGPPGRVLLDDGSEVPLSRRRRGALRDP
jgi:two-component system LytT family response regulator